MWITETVHLILHEVLDDLFLENFEYTAVHYNPSEAKHSISLNGFI